MRRRRLEGHAAGLAADRRGTLSCGDLSGIVLLKVGGALRVAVEAGLLLLRLERRLNGRRLLLLLLLLLRLGGLGLRGNRGCLRLLDSLVGASLRTKGLGWRLVEQVQAAELNAHGWHRGLLRSVDGRLVEARGSVELLGLLRGRSLNLLLFLVALNLSFKLSSDRLILSFKCRKVGLRLDLLRSGLLLLLGCSGSSFADNGTRGVLVCAGGHGCSDVGFAGSMVVGLLVGFDFVGLLACEDGVSPTFADGLS